MSKGLTERVESEIRERYEKELQSKLSEEREILRKKLKEEIADETAVEMKDLNAQLDKKTKQLDETREAELTLRKKQRELDERKKTLDLELEKKLEQEREKIKKEAFKQYAAKQGIEVKVLEDELASVKQTLSDAQQKELVFRKEKRELQKEKEKIELEVARKIDGERNKIRAEVLQVTEEKHKFENAGKDKQIEDMCKQVTDMKRKLEQGSQQAQGEIAELILEDILREEFQFDVITPVGKGIKGADVIQEVKTNSGRICGKIIWESKRTKAWNEGWLSKIRGDQQSEKAEIAVLVSETLPKGKRFFFQVKDIWVTDFATALCLAAALRKELIAISSLRQAMIGQTEKKDYLYHYVTGSEFKNRIAIMLEAFTSLQTQLEKERKAMQAIWANREKQLRKVIDNTSGMYGDLQGIVGKSLAAITPLALQHDDSSGDTILN